MRHAMKLGHAPFLKVTAGTKTVEMRLFDEKRARISAGDVIAFTDTETGGVTECLVTGVLRYPTFAALYAAHDKVSLGYGEFETAKPEDMLAYYTPEEIEKYGAAAICLRTLPERVMKQLLITGFEPFGGESENASWQAVKLLPEKIGEYKLIKAEVPVVFGKAGGYVISLAEQIGPDAILCTGQAAGRDRLTPEYAALNVRHAELRDNGGSRPALEPVNARGENAYFSTMDVYSLAQAAKAAGVRAGVSFHAGTFVCNDLFYTLLHRFGGSLPVGFVHVPPAPDHLNEGRKSMPVNEIAWGLEAMIKAL